ncbi:transposase [Paenibacillus naphthalenovorans]|uniref:transposase n=1 Tax=Paenibacillus naphthalenovorans TaxID=162209 RepID=UPI00078269FA|nr:transposase [Paenibacillus naphthalenovorans]
MKDFLETVFTAILGFLVEEKYVRLEHYFVDGTKIEANANKYTFVWGKAVVKHKAKLQHKPKDKPLKKAVRMLRKDLLPPGYKSMNDIRKCWESGTAAAKPIRTQRSCE